MKRTIKEGVKIVNFCTECGTKVEKGQNFCHKCGNPLPNDDSKNETKPILADNKALAPNYNLNSNCPFCHNGILEHHKHKKVGLFTKKTYLCTNCGITFEKDNKTFKLVNYGDNTNMAKYQNQSLQKREWTSISKGGLSDAEIIQKNNELKEANYKIFLNKLSSGTIKINPVLNTPIILKKGEEALITMNNVKYLEARSVRTSVGAHIGSGRRKNSFGLYTGVSQSRSVSHDEIQHIDTGLLVLTNKRLVFSGSKKNNNIQLNKIMSIKPYNDGMALQLENRQKTQYYTNTNKSSMNYTTNGRNYQFPNTGLLLKCAIQGLLK